jgi:hypothetical protein
MSTMPGPGLRNQVGLRTTLRVLGGLRNDVDAKFCDSCGAALAH